MRPVIVCSVALMTCCQNQVNLKNDLNLKENRMDTGILILIILAFIVALLVMVIKSGKGEAFLKLFGAEIGTKAGQEVPKNVLNAAGGSVAKRNEQVAKKGDAGQNVIDLENESEANDNVQRID
jgi:hypothetical protein